jgi:serine/threonine protein kinase
MGEVFRARDTKLEREVALKLLPPDFASDPERLARFEREAKLLASLNHPNVAAIYGLEEAGGQPFLASSWRRGRTSRAASPAAAFHQTRPSRSRSRSPRRSRRRTRRGSSTATSSRET